ncbi:MAG: sulfotransferase [Candidatus Omnitrophica bacterium]|nr:sulfotransferase [Candidatus Omnitrophota bacterium]
MDPIFIVGTERSGTNLLRLILNTHSEIAIPHPPHIMKNFSKLEPLYGDMKNDVNFRAFVKDVIRMIELHPYPWGVKLNAERVFCEARSRDLISVFFSVYNQYLETTSKARWGCKSTFMIYHIASILQHYPSAKFLYIVRDGRDVAVSAKKSIFNRYCVYYTAQLWKKEQQIGMYWLNKLDKDNMLLLKYEGLLSESETTLRSICSFLNEPYQENMLNFFHTQEAKKSGSLSASWRNTSSPIIKNNSEKFKVELRKDEIDLFENIASEELGYFSYRLNRPFYVSETARSKGIRFKISYLVEEFFLMLKVQGKHLFTDKNKLLRFKKFWFLKSIRLVKAIKWN